MSIRTRVGRNVDQVSGFNGTEDVRTVRILLNMVYPHERLNDATGMDEGLVTAIERFQREVVRVPEPDGFITPRGRTWRRLVEETSDDRFRVLNERCVRRPSYQMMRRAYQAYRANSRPCNRSYVPNQCAIRLCVALYRCGVDISHLEGSFHEGTRSCGTAIPHVAGAHDLAKMLRRHWGEPQKFRHDQHREAQQRLRGRPGVIYFDNCYVRRNRSGKNGDHIDLWTGEKYFNQILRVRAGGNAGANARLFSLADDGVWFWPLH